MTYFDKSIYFCLTFLLERSECINLLDYKAIKFYVVRQHHCITQIRSVSDGT